jgi:hypothetical protein
VEKEWKARRRAGAVVRGGLVMKRLASSARVDRGRKMGALLAGAHSKRAGVGAGEALGAGDMRGRGGGGMRRWVEAAGGAKM